jgi:hypothetical protein
MLLSSKFSDIWNSAVENAKCQEYPTPHVAASLKKCAPKASPFAIDSRRSALAKACPASHLLSSANRTRSCAGTPHAGEPDRSKRYTSCIFTAAHECTNEQRAAPMHPRCPEISGFSAACMQISALIAFATPLHRTSLAKPLNSGPADHVSARAHHADPVHRRIDACHCYYANHQLML